MTNIPRMQIPLEVAMMRILFFPDEYEGKLNPQVAVFTIPVRFAVFNGKLPVLWPARELQAEVHRTTPGAPVLIGKQEIDLGLLEVDPSNGHWSWSFPPP